MTAKNKQDNDLTSNQENLIAFLVIGLFGLMYLFFMNGDEGGLDLNGLQTEVAATTPIISTTTSTSLTNQTANTKVNRRDTDRAPKVQESTQVEKTSLLSDKVSIKDSAAKESELKAALKLEMLETERKNAEIAASKALEIEMQKTLAIAEKLAAAEKLVDAERMKAEKIALQLAEANKLKAQAGEMSAAKTAELAANLEAERKLAEEKRLEAEAAKMKLAELKQVKADEAAKLLSAQAQQDAEAARIKAEQEAMRLAEINKAKAEADEAARKLAEETARNKAEAEEATRKLTEETARIKAEAEEAARKLAEETARNKAEAEEAARKLAEETARNKAEAEEAARKLEEEASRQDEVQARIKAAQEALILQERNRLDFSLPDGRSIRIPANGFVNTLKTSIIDGAINTPIIFDQVSFASGSANLNRRSIRQIEGTASILQSYENTNVLLRGHTDNTGNNESNVALSLSRSLNIKKKLVALGISPTRINVEGLGSSAPIADNATAEGRKLNRRTDLLVRNR